MTLDGALAYLESFANFEQVHDPKAMRGVRLERMRELLTRLGDPQRRFRTIVVAGTNGKGSISAMLYSMLRESAIRVGLYTSPHLEHFRERIRMWGGSTPSADSPAERTHGDDWIGNADFAVLVERMQPALDAMRREGPENVPTYFEVLTALAFLYFAERGVEVAVLEVGLGGRLDATNVVDQAVSVLGPIDVDHADILGADPVAIAREKAGIIKSNQTVISLPQRADVAAVLREAAAEHGVPMLRCGEELQATVHEHDLDGLSVSITGIRGRYPRVSIPLLGRHQAQNAAAAIGALEALSSMGVPHSIARRGLSRVIWPGRLEVVCDAPLVMLDGAHNPHAATALRDTLAELCPGRRVHALIGMSSDKSVEDVGRCLSGLAVSAICVRSRHPRALEPQALAQRLAPFIPQIEVMADPVDAYTYLLNTVPPNEAIVVTGSLFLVGELRAALRQAHVRPRRRLRRVRAGDAFASQTQEVGG